MTTALSAQPAGTWSGSRMWLARAFLWLLLVQGFHFFEHCVELVQRFWLNDPTGNGLLGNLAGFEQLHLGYNTLYLLGLLWIYGEVSLAARPAWSRHTLVAGLLAGAVAIQGYHEMEHLLRMGQVLGWLQAGPAVDAASGEPPGLVGRWFNGVLVHWVLNGVVEALPVAAFVVGGFSRLLSPRSSRRSKAIAG